MGIATVLVIQTIINIVTLLALQTVIYFFGIEPGIDYK